MGAVGHADCAAPPAGTSVRVAPMSTVVSVECPGGYLKTINFWAGNITEMPRMVRWMCPRCRVVTVSTSCPVCCPQP